MAQLALEGPQAILSLSLDDAVLVVGISGVGIAALVAAGLAWRRSSSRRRPGEDDKA